MLNIISHLLEIIKWQATVISYLCILAFGKAYKGALNGREKIPLPAWKAEREKLTADKKRLDNRYIALKGEVKEVEKIHRNVYDILREETREAQRTRARDMEH